MCVCVQYEKERTREPQAGSRRNLCPRCRQDHSVAVEIKRKINSQILIIDINIKVAFFNKFKFKNNQRECFFQNTPLHRSPTRILFEKNLFVPEGIIFCVCTTALPANGCLQQTFMHQNGVYPVLHSQRQIHVCYTSNNILDCCSSSTTTTTTTTTSRAVYVKTIFHRLGS